MVRHKSTVFRFQLKYQDDSEDPPPFGKKVGVPRTLESAMLVTKCVRDVQNARNFSK